MSTSAQDANFLYIDGNEGKPLGEPLLSAEQGQSAQTNASRCTSHLHEPGMCHGFDMHKGSNWTIAHGDFSFKNPGTTQADIDAAKRKNDMMVLGASAVLMSLVMILELVSGTMLHSLALWSDGMHYASDVALYGWLLVSVILSNRKEDLGSYSFGYHRAQVLGALMALMMQYSATGVLIFFATDRLFLRPRHIDGLAVGVVGSISLASNLALLHFAPGDASGHGHSHGGGSSHSHGGGGDAVTVARLHMLGDLVQGSAVILTGIISWIFPQCTWADPCSTFVYACVVLGSSWRIFKELLHTLMERAPMELDVQGLYDDMTKVKGVIDIHCCHVWALAPGKVAMSAHLHIEDEMHEEVLHAAQILVKHKYGIVHSTLQISEDEDLA